MDKTALLKKIRALAEHGVGGEAENAEKLLARMMKKYGISEEELDEETRVRHDFTYHGGEEKKILKQVVYKVTGGYTYEPTSSYIPRAGARLGLNSARIALPPKRRKSSIFSISIKDFGKKKRTLSSRPTFKSTVSLQYAQT